jgi:hypothetical protein
MSDERSGDSRPTLTRFIEENHKLISTLAILAALSAFSNNLSEKEYGKILSFLFFTLSLLVFVEIELNFPYTTGGRLYWFRQIFGLTAIIFFLAWVHMYYGVLIVTLYMIVWLFVLVLIFAFFQMAIRKALLWLLKTASEKTRTLVPLFGAMLPTAVVVFLLRRYSDSLTLFVLHRALHL